MHHSTALLLSLLGACAVSVYADEPWGDLDMDREIRMLQNELAIMRKHINKMYGNIEKMENGMFYSVNVLLENIVTETLWKPAPPPHILPKTNLWNLVRQLMLGKHVSF